MQKVCAMCKELKPAELFGVRSGSKHLQSYCIPCRRISKAQERARAMASGNRVARSAYLMKRYGVTLEQVEAMAKKQSNRCAICRRKCRLVGVRNAEDTFHLDHDHSTGRVRGLLCRKCNVAISLLGEDEMTISRALTYIKVTPPDA